MNTESIPNPNDGISPLGKSVQQTDNALRQNRIMMAGYQKLQALVDRQGYISKTEVRAIIVETMQQITS